MYYSVITTHDYVSFLNVSKRVGCLLFIYLLVVETRDFPEKI